MSDRERWQTERMSDLGRWWPAVLDGHTEIRERLLDRYDEQQRGYHDRRHLAEVFERVEVLVGADPAARIDRDPLLLAVWFHDAVYDTREDMEERSARLAARELTIVGAPPLLVEEVTRLVRLTASHQPDEEDETGKVLCDADLAILAADGTRYAEYVGGVRAEYADLADEDFRAGRARVLAGLLGSPSLFSTGYGRRHWELPARRNLEAELAGLTRPETS